MCSVFALQDWCRGVCEGYSDVQITDMSSSFADGLAFCAIIHKHRPDLLDFHSLSKHSVCENMRLAFNVAERELGIPPLLDPEELMCEEKPDLLSIITYVSQLFCVFKDAQKIPVDTESSRRRSGEQTHTQLFSSAVVRSADRSVCSVCHTRVHLIERVLVKGQLYHRSCFRCSVCRRSLLPMSFTEDSETGLLHCSYNCNPAAEHTDQHRQSGETDGDDEETDRETHVDRTSEERLSTLIETDVGEGPEHDRPTDQQSQTEISETDGDGSERDGDEGTGGHLSSSSQTDLREPPIPAPRKGAEPQEAPGPASRSQEHLSDNVLSQSVVRKDHPWLKLVHPGPWYHLPPATGHSRHRPATFNPFLENEDETKCEEPNSFSCETSVEHKPQTSSSVPSMQQDAAPINGFPLIKRKVITEKRVSEKEVCEEQKKLEERLLELERRGVQLERDMRRCSEDNLLADWFILIHKKNMLVRRDSELVYMLKQQRLEDQQADVEFEIRRLFNKPEELWSDEDRHQEDQLISLLLSIIQQRNDIISSLDLDREREEEEDMMLSAVIQRIELQTQTDKQLEKCSRRLRRFQMFRTSSRKTKSTGRRQKKNS